MFRRALLLAVFHLATLVPFAQQNDVPLQRDIYLDLERNAACRTNTMHSGLKPLIESRADLTGVMGYRPDSSRHYYPVTEKLFKEHLVQVKYEDFRVTADPVFQFELGQDFRDPSEFADTTRFYVNSRGALVRCDLGPRLSFQTTFYENQAIYPRYLYNYAQAQGVVPGQGRIKGFKNRAFDFAWSMGNISWSPRRWINVQFGHGKHFVGHGYRSMLLSDNAFNYPYLKISYLGPGDRLQYTTIHAKLQMVGTANRLPIDATSEPLFYWKRATFHHLSYRLGRVELGLFETTIWHDIDADGVKPFNPMELNPVIGINTVAVGFNDPAKSLVGLDARMKMTDKFFVYGQFALDDPEHGRHAWQGGLRCFDLFQSDLSVQLEYNTATPYTYAHRPAQIGYTHYGQPLAHPQGAYFSEAVAIADWRISLRNKKRLIITAKVNLIEVNQDPTDDINLGSDIFKPLEVYTGDSTVYQRQITFLDLSASWLWNQMTNLRMTVGYRMRDITPALDYLNSGYLYATFQTGLFNKYYDL